MKKITIEISNKEANVLTALLKMKGGMTDCARTVLIDGLSMHLDEVKRNVIDECEFKQELDFIKRNNLKINENTGRKTCLSTKI